MNTMIAIIDEQAEVLTIPTAREAAEQAEKQRILLAEAHRQELLKDFPKIIKYFTNAINAKIEYGYNQMKFYSKYHSVRKADWEEQVGMTWQDFDLISDEFIKIFRNLGYDITYNYLPYEPNHDFDEVNITISW